MLVRRIARPMLASIFVIMGADALRDPSGRAVAVTGFADSYRSALPDAVCGAMESAPENLVRANGLVQVGGGLMLAAGRYPRVAAGTLAASMGPTTVIGHDFWNESDPAQRKAQMVQFLKNLGLTGGLLLAAVDTEGKPSLGWRGRRAIHKMQEAVVTAGPGGADTTARHGAELTETAAQRGAEWADAARRWGGDVADSAGSAGHRGSQWADAALHRGAEWAETARKRGAELTDVAESRGAGLAETARKRGAELADAAESRGAEWAEAAGDWAGAAGHRGGEWLERAQARAQAEAPQLGRRAQARAEKAARRSARAAGNLSDEVKRSGLLGKSR
ncbi:DoxX family protein [Tomitella fengzijianii]|uniref:DoxX family protein n=1 Tax=Tomitella fengzijianii TaxID=2597660 RepID=A0A516X401_9ACTN|nr:DoxX family protein [Tomitella fengzijianii]QDQ97798.1 DoxX family protein [Tomitella fengzijianii]